MVTVVTDVLWKDVFFFGLFFGFLARSNITNPKDRV